MATFQSKLRRLALVVLLSFGVTFLAGTMTGAAAQEERVLVIGHAEFTDSLDPARAFSTTAFIVHRATYDSLVTYPDDSVATIEPNMATSWEVSDDGTVYTFTLRDDVVFSNGDPLTAGDVAFSLNRLQRIKGNPSFLAETIQSAEADGDYSVVITLIRPDPTLLARLVNTTFSITNADEVRAAGGMDAEDAAASDAAEAWLNSHSAGTGPYILESWTRQVETVLVRNPNYWGEAPYFDRVVIANLPEAATQKVALESGDISLALDLTPDQLPDLRENPDIEVWQGASTNLHYLMMNQDPEIGGPLSNPRVQLAVRYALDYEGYVDLWGGTVPASVIPPGFFAAYGPDRAFQRDLARARELLTEAGYPDGFETTLHYPSWTFGGANWDTNAQKLQADLAEVGIRVNLSPGEVGVKFEEYRAGNEGFGYWFWHPDYIDPGNYLAFLPGQILGLRARWTDANADSAILELRDRALVELDPETRIEIFAAIQDYLREQGPWAPFLFSGAQAAYRKDIAGYVYHPQWLLDVALLRRVE